MVVVKDVLLSDIPVLLPLGASLLSVIRLVIRRQEPRSSS
jgi:hypothetical protein